MIKLRSILFYLTIMMCSGLLKAQGVDSLFMQARQYAFNGERAKAREICNRILTVSPTYTDVRILLGRTYSWDGKRDSARAEFYKVLAYDSSSTEAWSSLSDVEFWDDRAQASLEAAENGIRFNPGNKELMLKKTRALIDLKQYTAAKEEIARIKETDTACAECKELSEKIYRLEATGSFTVGATAEYFDEKYDPFYYGFVQVGKKLPKNTLIFRLNYNQRFGTNGFQPEIDMYPSVAKKMYAYVNYGFSIYSLFPKHRIGLELYRNFPRSYEVSIGGRYLNFGANSEVYIFTASVTKYVGNYAIIGRTFITPDTRSFSRSFILNLRKYYADQDNYIGITGGFGYSPDQRIITSNANLGESKIYFMESQRVGLVFSKTYNFKHVFMLDLDYRYQELPVGENSTSTQFIHNFGIGLTYKIKY